jgi:hypothetical protein
VQEIGGALRERLISAQKASSLFARIRCCTLFFAGFAVNVAVFGFTLVDPLIWGQFNDANIRFLL